MGRVSSFLIKQLRGSDKAEHLIKTLFFVSFLVLMIRDFYNLPDSSGVLFLVSVIGIGFIVENIYYKIEKLNQKISTLKE